MKTSLFISIAGIALVCGACNPTFLVSKEGKGYFLGSNSRAKYDMLCTSGDLEKVLASTQLSMEMKDTLYRSNCSAERSADKVQQIYVSMTPDQRKDIKNAFRKAGYDINYLPCCGDQINDTSGQL
jgi:hypothetical protein